MNRSGYHVNLIVIRPETIKNIDLEIIINVSNLSKEIFIKLDKKKKNNPPRPLQRGLIPFSFQEVRDVFSLDMDLI